MMNEVLLTSICRPKQWKTISTKELEDSGYPVYGANGRIGFYNSYTHEKPTILITCRGATCGTINICEAKSYVNGNAMALDNLSEDVDMYFLKHFLEYRKLDDVISGSAQPQITGQGLSKIKIPLPPLATQQKIAAILDAADELRQKDKALISKYDELTQALFLDMFGDPVTNPKGWEKVSGKAVFKLIGGAAFKSSDYTSQGLPLIRIGTVNKGYFDGAQLTFLPSTFEKSHSRYIVYPNDLLITLTGTVGKDDYGNAFTLTYEYKKYLLNQRVAKISSTEKYNLVFLKFYLQQKKVKNELIGVSRGVRQANLSNEDFYKLEVITPSTSLQNQFAERVKAIEEQKSIAQASALKSEELFNSLLQKAFKGELV